MKTDKYKNKRTEEFIELVFELKKWFEDIGFPLGYTDTFYGNLAILIQKKITTAITQTEQRVKKEVLDVVKKVDIQDSIDEFNKKGTVKNKDWKEVYVTPCCKTRHWHSINADGRYGDFIRCESCNGKFDKELLEKVMRGLNPVTYFCDKCGISAEILNKQQP